MADQNSPEGREQGLHDAVEALAKRFVLEADDDWDSVGPGFRHKEDAGAALRGIAEQARAEGRAEIAGIASELLESGKTAEEFSAGIRRLQDALAQPAGALEARENGPAAANQEAPVSLGQDPELVADFVLESREHLASIENQILELEQDPEKHDALHSAFRGFHTIKGLAGFLDLATIQEVAHEVETVLDLARNRKLVITPGIIDVLLSGADFLKSAIQAVEDGLQGGPEARQQTPAPLLRRVRSITDPSREEEKDEAVREPEEAGAQSAEAPAPVPAQQPPAGGGPAPGDRGPGTQAVKVTTGKLDHLVDMVGELVVAQSLLRHDPNMASIESPRLQRNLSQLSRITTDVQRTAMSMRMVPVGQLFRRLARLVRDLSHKEEKKVDLITRGDETELDRNIVEELADPLMHMIRNAIGHGLETPGERRKAGKGPTGSVELSAYHQSGFIVIELSDDGRGLNRERILDKAQQRGLVPEGAELSDHEVQSLIFEPGFSTAAEVSDVSGRGVGMDVVRRNIMKLRGRVDIRSVEGRGTTFTLKMPLTLAIIEGLIVGVGSERYIVPIYTVREMLRPTADAMSTLQGRDEMVMVRGKLLPVVRLYRRFAVEPRSEDPTQSLLLVTENLGKSFCLMVDELTGKQEVVIKSLGETLKNVEGVAGGAILGDGQVGLILDMDGLFGARGNG